ncbi:MAG TPA: hypothetical protein VIQ00_16545 [Chitinophagaceae bacterium]
MNINQHNYEAFFIQYLDNELSVEESLMVENFLNDHPELAEEMELLQQARLLPDDSIQFFRKEQLLKETHSVIHANNYQEYFLLSVDNELTASEVMALQSFIADNPDRKKELELLQKTKLQPEESIVFADKNILYRTEKDEKVFRMGWWKISVAAALLITFGAATFIALNNSTTNGNQQPVAIQSKPVEKGNTIKTNTGNHQPSGTIESNKPQGAVVNEEQSAQYAVTNSVSPNKKRITRNNDASHNAVTDAATIAKNEVPKPNDAPIKIKDLTPNDIALNTELPKHTINGSAVTNQPGGSSEIKAIEPEAAYITAVNDEPNNKRIRGFFRKATRIFERTTNITATNDDDKLLVGAFAINLK